MTPVALAVLAALTTHGGPDVLYRPDAPTARELWTFDPGDTVLTYGTTNFLVHYTEAGTHAVPAGDTNTNNIPDHVEQVAQIYEDVLDFYTNTLGYAAPPDDSTVAGNNGGDARYDVYLVDFAFMSDGSFQQESCASGNTQCTGFVVQENDFLNYGYPSTDYANRLLASHEFFHFIQAGYRDADDVVLSEGTAVWASEAFDPTLGDLEGFSRYYLAEPDRSINVPPTGPVPSFAYGSSIFFQFLGEAIDPTVVRGIFEAQAAAEEDWLEVSLPAVLSGQGEDFADAFTQFAQWNLFTDSRADPAQSYGVGAALDPVTMTPTTLPFSDDALRVFHASTQYYEADAAGREEVAARLIDDGDGTELDGLRLFLVRLAADEVLEIHEVMVGDDTIATDGAQSVVAMVVNTRTQGPSRRPALCFGSPSEVANCAGTPDTGDAKGCSCAMTGPRQPKNAAWLAALVAAVGVAIRRRRHRP